MRIIHVSDLHGHRPWYDWLHKQAAACDAIVISGDLINLFGNERAIGKQVTFVKEWVKAFPKNLLVCSGNHDAWLTKDVEIGAGWMNQLKAPHVTIDGETTEIGGLSFHCVPWNNVPDSSVKADILVCHAPPSGIETARSRVTESDFGDFELAGSLLFSTRPPWLLLGGHEHNPVRWCARVPTEAGHCWSLNPGQKDEAELPNHIIIDTTKAVAACVNSSGREIVRLLRT